MKRFEFALAIATLACGGYGGYGCATSRPSPELVDARAAYARAHAGPAVEANAAGLGDAKKALDDAEKRYADEPSSEAARHLAYIAYCKVLAAEATARANIAETQRARTEKTLAAIRAHKLQEKQQNLDDESERKARDRREQHDNR
jgi:hypothetical protein